MNAANVDMTFVGLEQVPDLILANRRSMNHRVLLCVLDWGLGHATRCLALVEQLQAHNYEVIVASSGRALALLRLELPRHMIYELPGYDVHYNSPSFEWGMVTQSRKILDAISQEQVTTREILAKEKIDLIISDNRYGCHNPEVKSIFLSHHLQIRFSGLWKIPGTIVNSLHRRLIRKFSEVWVPDYPDHLLSGDLSRSDLDNLTFIGPLSSMRRSERVLTKKYDLLAVLSGPEPGRSRLSDILYNQLKGSGKNFLLVEGRPEKKGPASGDRVEFMTRSELSEAIQESHVVISRSGYSTVMDLATLGCKAVFIPTPGQTEQLYLAQQLEEKRIAFQQPQDNFELARALGEVVNYMGFDGLARPGNDLLRKAISNLIS